MKTHCHRCYTTEKINSSVAMGIATNYPCSLEIISVVTWDSGQAVRS